MSRKVRDCVAVITGASSGIGRATALEFARRGAAVVLAARREEALQEAARECESLGAQALAAPTDVTDEAAVRRLAEQAIARFGRIDVWVNDAAVSLFARLEEAPMEDYRRVIETNLIGCVHGVRAALPYLKEQGGGTIINVSSVVSEATQPYTSAYVASKWGVRAISDCLRMELELDGQRNIHVCTVMPATIDTPLFQQAANYTGRAAKALPPVYPASEVARRIVRLARHPEREAVVGRAGQGMVWWKRLAPGSYERYAAHQVDRNHLSDRPADRTSGNLFEPAEGLASVSGGWLQDGQASTGKWAASLALAAGAAAGAAAVAWWAQRSGALDEPLQSLRAKTSSSLASARSYAKHAYANQW